MFAITDLEDAFGVVLKCDPEEFLNMRERYPSVNQARYFRGSWNHILIDGSIDVGQIKEWIDQSYALIVKNLPGKDKKALAEL